MSELVTSSMDGLDMTQPLTRAEAEELTAHIRNAADVMWVLIARAHAGRVWEALDYPSWEAYVQDEFHMSRSRAYQLLDQARVVTAIQAAAPVGTSVDINEKTARDLKKVLAEVTEDVSERTSGMSADEAEETIDDILNEWRSKSAAESGSSSFAPTAGAVTSVLDDDPYGIMSGSPSLGGGGGFSPAGDGSPIDDFDTMDLDPGSFMGAESPAPETPAPSRPTPAQTGVDPATLRRVVQACYDLYSSLSSLKAMPEIDSIINAIPAERYGQVTENLPLAMEWLGQFSEAWQEHLEAQAEDGQ